MRAIPWALFRAGACRFFSRRHRGTEGIARRCSQQQPECVLALCLSASVRKYVARKVVRRVAVRYAAWVECCLRFCVCCLSQVLDSFSHGGTEGIARRCSQQRQPNPECVLSLCLSASVRKHAACKVVRRVAVRFVSNQLNSAARFRLCFSVSLREKKVSQAKPQRH